VAKAALLQVSAWSARRAGKLRWVSHRSRALWLPAYAFAVVMLGTTLPTPLYPRYEREFGFSPLLITVIYGVYAAGVIAALLLLGGVSDQVGRRPALFASIILSAASAVAFLLAGGVWALLAGRILSGFSAGLCTGSATAALVDLKPDRRSQASALATAVNLGGLGCGTLLAGVLATVGPAPLRLPFWVDLGLLLVAFAAVLRMVEPVRRAGRQSLPARGLPARGLAARGLAVQRLHVPAPVRPTFIRAAAAGFAAFALFGLFSAVAPTFLATVLHQTSPALAGGVVFILFAASAAGQLAVPRIPAPAGLPAGCAGIIAGALLTGAALAASSLGLLIAGAIVAGTGQGIAVGSGLAALNTKTPTEHRGEVDSSYFVAAYAGVSIPIIGVGLLSQVISLRSAAYALIAFVTVVTAVSAASLVRNGFR
jgi:MFS family permease